MKVSYVVTLDAPDVPKEEATYDQVEVARAVIQRVVSAEVEAAGIHVTTTVQRGLPLHPFLPHCPAPHLN